jgi:NAD(P)-dependent dehydrogenase (short-subunit alcohol dehydrogenase family)
MTTALITGANKGLGFETARQLGRQGWTVLLGCRDPELGAKAAAALAGDGVDARPVVLDVTDDASVAAAVATVADQVDHLDVLVNNAGITGGRTAPLDTTPADVLACYETNVFGPVRVTRAFVDLLRAAPLPRVVMVSSGLGSLTVTSEPGRLESTLNSLIYPSSKTALNMITTQYAKALPGWKVNAVDPGYTATDLNAHNGTKTVEQGAKAIVAMATIDADGPTGGFFDDHGTVPW